jgi:capsular exopolysaccharide synthesis family protein
MTAAPRLLEVKSAPAPDNVTVIGRPAFTLSSSLIAGASVTGAAAEAIRALRTHLMAQHFQGGRRALAVCAASGGVGCSFVASNLALGLSQIGVKTLLIDGNLRDPSLHAVFGASAQPIGLAECLASDEPTFGDFIQSEVRQDLSVMFAGYTPRNPQELLAASRFQDLMEFCMREFEATVIDTPPANVCADARRVSTVIGYSLIVARRNASYVDDVKALAGQLAADHASVVGCVLNEA